MSRQDVENAAPIRIAALGEHAQQFGFTQAILFAYCQETGTVVTTWGIDAERSAQAAKGANIIKQNWGWPEATILESAKVHALQDRIKELEAQVSSGGLPNAKLPKIAPTVHVIQGTEYERGWGQRPDGYVAFTSKKDALRFIADYNERHNTAKHAPDEYTVYDYIGIMDCSDGFHNAVVERNVKHFDRRSELLE